MKVFKIIKIIFLIIVFGALLYLLLLKNEDKKNSPSENSSPTAEEKKESTNLNFTDLGVYEYESESLLVSAVLPLDEEGNFVEEVRDYGVRQVEQFQKSHSEIENLPDTASFPWSLDVDYKKYESQTITSYLVQTYEYTAGAHGNIVLKSFNYSKENGNLLEIEDIISSEDSLQRLSNIAVQELTVEYEEGVSGEEKNWKVWYADDDSVTFMFVPYQIASYAVGQQELRVVANAHPNLFKEKYFRE